MNNANLDNSKNKIEKIKPDFKDSKYATGRRKRSIARVWVKKGSGKIFVNGKDMNQYFKRPVHQISVARPLNEIKIEEIKKIVRSIFKSSKNDIKKN